MRLIAKIGLFILAALPGFISQAEAQTTAALRQKIERIIAKKKALVGVSIIGNGTADTLSLNGDLRFPMQSVFKFHIALAVLAQVDKGKLSLNQKVTIPKKHLLPNLHSPIREKYPEGASLPLADVLEETVTASDNVGCDALLRLLGGPQVVEAYFTANRFTDLAIKINEEQQQARWDLQFQNWTTPKAASRTLLSFYQNKEKLLSPKSHRSIWQLMRETKTGPNRLRGQLPAKTTVAHKTGSSGTNPAGITAAVNDIGIVFLPDGSPLFISVFVTRSTEDTATNEKIIADIARAAWDHFTRQ